MMYLSFRVLSFGQTETQVTDPDLNENNVGSTDRRFCIPLFTPSYRILAFMRLVYESVLPGRKLATS